jgi:hypothetical protein
LTTLAALEAVLFKHQADIIPGQAVLAAMAHYQ